MLFHESIIYAVGDVDLSVINISCDESQKEEIANFFETNFEKDWSDAQDSVEEEYGDCLEKDEECGSIATVVVEDDGVRVYLGPLCLSYQDGDYVESEGYAAKALDKSLKRLLNKYPKVSYEGYIAYSWSDVHGGETEQWELSSNVNPANNSVKAYPFLGELLAQGMKNEEFWDKLTEYLDDFGADIDDFKVILNNFYIYKKWLPDDCFESLMNVSDNIDDNIRPELQDLLDSLENGENVAFCDDVNNERKLPDGYEEALDTVAKGVAKARMDEIDSELYDEED